MRIIAGSAKGRPLQGPGNAKGVRPTADRVRETIFNVLGQWLDGCRVLDLFAGTGALGFEALSRGAVHLTAVDTDLRWVRKNAQALGFQQVELLELPAARALELLAKRGAQFDLAFADPPYAMEVAAEVLEGLQPLAKTIVIEHGKREAAPPGFSDQRKFGDTIVSIYQRVESSE